MLEALEATGEPQIDVVMDEEPEEIGAQDFTRYRRQGILKAFVNIIEGCNYRCSYCIVPAVRGAFTSRQPEAIVDEVRQLVDAGMREVNLLGQSVLAYGRDRGREFDIVDLFARLHDIAGLQRIRFTTNHPLEMNERVIAAMAEMPRVMEHAHMPIQAGDDRLLKAMKRGYTVERYEALVDEMRERIPGLSVTGDVIVGFPGETEEMFRTCVETYRRLRLDQQFLFVYSARPGTPAAALPDQLPQAVKVARMNELVALQNSLSTARNQATTRHGLRGDGGRPERARSRQTMPAARAIIKHWSSPCPREQRRAPATSSPWWRKARICGASAGDRLRTSRDSAFPPIEDDAQPESDQRPDCAGQHEEPQQFQDAVVMFSRSPRRLRQ